MKRKRFFWTRLIAFSIITAVIAVGFVWADNIETFVNANILGNHPHEGGLAVHFISGVGQADAAVVQFPNGQVMVVDAGAPNDNSRNALLHYMTNYIFPHNTPRSIDLFVATHSHADHIGGAANSFNMTSALFDNFYVSHIIRPISFTMAEIEADIHRDQFGIETRPTMHDTAIFRNFVTRINSHTCINGQASIVTIPYVGKQMHFGDAYIKFYSPTRPFYGNLNSTPGASGDNAINQTSTVFSLNYAGRRVLFTGDAYIYNEDNIINTLDANGRTIFGTLPGEIYKVDVLDVGHHGSNTSTGLNLLRKIQPTYAVIQVGAANSYGHPHTALINRLVQYVNPYNILTTMDDGDILIQIRADGQLTVAGVIQSDLPGILSGLSNWFATNGFWVEYWMIAIPIIILSFLLLLAMDFFGKNNASNTRKNTNRRNQAIPGNRRR